MIIKARHQDSGTDASTQPGTPKTACARNPGLGLLLVIALITAATGGCSKSADNKPSETAPPPVAAKVAAPTGSLRLDSDPSGATVRQGATTLGQTPLVIPALPVGECQLALDYPGWPGLSFKATIQENVESVETVRLPHGKVTIETTPAGATVLLRGKALGQTPLTIDPLPAGATKLTLQAADFPTLELAVTVKDRDDLKLRQPMGAGFPELDPAALLQAVWVPTDADALAPRFDSVTGIYQPQNGIVKNLHRKRLYENWLRKSYRYSGTVKSYDAKNSVVEFAEQTGDLSKYRVVAKLPVSVRDDPDKAAQLAKGATFELYGRLNSVEEPRWPAKVITLELSPAAPLR